MFLSRFNGQIRAFEQTNVTNKFLRFLMEPCVLSPGFNLSDLFLFLEKDIDFWKTACQCPFLPEFIEEIKRPCQEDSDLDVLEIYWQLNSDILDKKKFNGIIHPGFHGKKKDSLENYSIELTPLNEIKNLPLVLSDETFFHKERKSISLGSGSYSVIHIVYAILREISFHGNPDNRGAVLKRINNAMDDVDD